MVNVSPPSSTLSSRLVILCFVPYYLPGYRSGGPVRSIANLVDHLADEFDVRIVTLNRDASACQPYPLVDINAWNTVGKARVFYCAPNLFTYIYFLRIILTSQYDILYLNSFFDIRFSLLPLILRRIGLVPRKPCVIAPRGQFSAGALFFKPRGKRLYIIGSKIFRIFGGLFWQASCSSEKSDISRELGPIAKNIKVVPNLTPISIDPVKTDIRSPGCLRLVFISRITPKKNLDFLLRSLIHVSGNVILSIYGPYEDTEYLQHCQVLISRLPANVKVSLYGPLPQEQVRNIFAQNDLFVFPTLGENFGHVIHESLSVGTPVLVSDTTPWFSDPNRGLQALELNASLWITAIESWTRLSDESLIMRKKAALDYYKQYLLDIDSVALTRSMFRDLCPDS